MANKKKRNILPMPIDDRIFSPKMSKNKLDRVQSKSLLNKDTEFIENIQDSYPRRIPKSFNTPEIAAAEEMEGRPSRLNRLSSGPYNSGTRGTRYSFVNDIDDDGQIRNIDESAPWSNDVVINEIFNPPAGGIHNSYAWEYIELYNSGTTTADISGWHFGRMGNNIGGDEGYTVINRELLNDTTTYENELSAAFYERYYEVYEWGDAPIHFTFPNGTTIPPGGFMVVARPYCPVATFYRCTDSGIDGYNLSDNTYYGGIGSAGGTEFCTRPENQGCTQCCGYTHPGCDDCGPNGAPIVGGYLGGNCLDICGGTESQQPAPPWDPESQWYDEDAYGHLVEGENLIFWDVQSNRSHNQTLGYWPGWKQEHFADDSSLDNDSLSGSNTFWADYGDNLAQEAIKELIILLDNNNNMIDLVIPYYSIYPDDSGDYDTKIAPGLRELPINDPFEMDWPYIGEYTPWEFSSLALIPGRAELAKAEGQYVLGQYDNVQGRNWKASLYRYGTPGLPNDAVMEGYEVGAYNPNWQNIEVMPWTWYINSDNMFNFTSGFGNGFTINGGVSSTTIVPDENGGLPEDWDSTSWLESGYPIISGYSKYAIPSRYGVFIIDNPIWKRCDNEVDGVDDCNICGGTNDCSEDGIVNGLCVCEGCMDPNAYNYDPLAQYQGESTYCDYIPDDISSFVSVMGVLADSSTGNITIQITDTLAVGMGGAPVDVKLGGFQFQIKSNMCYNATTELDTMAPGSGQPKPYYTLGPLIENFTCSDNVLENGDWVIACYGGVGADNEDETWELPTLNPMNDTLLTIHSVYPFTFVDPQCDLSVDPMCPQSSLVDIYFGTFPNAKAIPITITPTLSPDYQCSYLLGDLADTSTSGCITLANETNYTEDEWQTIVDYCTSLSSEEECGNWGDWSYDAPGTCESLLEWPVDLTGQDGEPDGVIDSADLSVFNGCVQYCINQSSGSACNNANNLCQCSYTPAEPPIPFNEEAQCSWQVLNYGTINVVDLVSYVNLILGAENFQDYCTSAHCTVDPQWYLEAGTEQLPDGYDNIEEWCGQFNTSGEDICEAANYDWQGLPPYEGAPVPTGTTYPCNWTPDVESINDVCNDLDFETCISTVECYWYNIINELGLIGMYDVNMDGIINVIDVVTLVNCILGLNNIGQEYDEYYMACASGTGSYIPPTTTYGCGGCVGNGLVDEVDSNGLCCGPGDL